MGNPDDRFDARLKQMVQGEAPSARRKRGAPYRVTGIGAGDAELVYEKKTLIEAARLTHKMTDFGVRSAHIFDPDGNEIALDEAYRIAGLTA